MQKYIRLTIDQPLDDAQLDQFYEIVDDTTDIILTTAINDDGEPVSDQVAITLYTEDDHLCYEVTVDDSTSSDDLQDIVIELQDAIANDFQIELVRE